MCLGGIAGTYGDIRWAGRLRMLVHVVAGVEVHAGEDPLHELPQRVALKDSPVNGTSAKVFRLMSDS